MKQSAGLFAVLSVLGACGVTPQAKETPTAIDVVDDASFSATQAAEWLPLQVGNRWAFGATIAEIVHVIEVRYTVDGMGVLDGLAGTGREAWFGFGTRSPSVFYVWNDDAREWSPFAKFGRSVGTTWTTQLDDGGCGTFEARVARRNFSVQNAAGVFKHAYQIDYALKPKANVRCAKPTLTSLTFVENVGVIGFGGAADQSTSSLLSAEVTGQRYPSIECRRTGCGGQVCADHDLVTTCIRAPDDSCYDHATCEAQPTGGCGWTETAELNECLRRVY